jgi:hypothetical protein
MPRRPSPPPPMTKRDKNGRMMTGRPCQDKPLNTFVENLDQDQFHRALAARGEDTREWQLLEALHDPAFAKCTISNLCRRFGVSMQDIMDMMKDYSVAEGTSRMMQHLPQVMEDVATDAQSRQGVCPRCQGTKELPPQTANGKPRKCPECKGTGEVRVSGDKHARDLVFETAGFTNKKTPLVAQQFNFGSSGLKPVLAETADLLEPGK